MVRQTTLAEKRKLAQRLLKQLMELFEHASTIWNIYQTVGPGRVDRKLFVPVDTARIKLGELLEDANLTEFLGVCLDENTSDWADQLTRAMGQASDLSERCACRPEGLCFITGEAGLIPRRDLHDAFTRSLAYLNECCQALQAALDKWSC